MTRPVGFVSLNSCLQVFPAKKLKGVSRAKNKPEENKPMKMLEDCEDGKIAMYSLMI